jgi:hypothetical protein
MPSSSPTSLPSRDVLRIGAGRFYIAYVSEDLAVDPTAAEFEALRAATEAYFLARAKVKLAASHPGVELFDLLLQFELSLHGVDSLGKWRLNRCWDEKLKTAW